MAFLKAIAAIFLAATAVFVKNVGPLQPKEDPKPQAIVATSFTFPDKFTVSGGSASLTVNFQTFSDGVKKEHQCMLFAQPTGWGKGDERLKEDNFKGNSTLKEFKEKLGKDETSTQTYRENFARVCSADVEGFAVVIFDLIQDSSDSNSWIFNPKDVENTFNGTYVSKSTTAPSK